MELGDRCACVVGCMVSRVKSNIEPHSANSDLQTHKTCMHTLALVMIHNNNTAKGHNFFLEIVHYS